MVLAKPRAAADVLLFLDGILRIDLETFRIEAKQEPRCLRTPVSKDGSSEPADPPYSS